MATTKTANSTASGDYEELSDQIAAIKGDIASLSELLGEIGARRKDETIEAARARAETLRKQAEAKFSDVRDQASDARDEAFDMVRRQPGTAIAVAVGVGFLVGILSGRR